MATNSPPTGASAPRSTAAQDPAALFSVAERSAVIIGASGALGGVAARALAAGGARLTLAGGDADRLSALADELTETGTPVTVVPCRSDTEESAQAIAPAAVDSPGGIDLLVVSSRANAVAPLVHQSPE